MPNDSPAHPERQRPRPLWIGLYSLVVLGYLFGVLRFWDAETGFTRLIAFGQVFSERALPAVREVPRYVHQDTGGYDGQFYAQIALDPMLKDPELHGAIDNLPYRSRRIFMPLVSWILGLGKPLWILNVFALINPITWIATALLLLRWLPPTNAENFIRWAGFLLGLGMMVSTRYALTDGPATFLVVLAVFLFDRNRKLAGPVAIALASLTKDTSLLAGALFGGSLETLRRDWKRIVLQSVIMITPLVLWMAYVHLSIPGGGTGVYGVRNFGYPLFGYVGKWVEVIDYAASGRSWRTATTMVAAHIATSIFLFYLILRPRPGDPWWRIGILFAILGVFLGPAVWETYPGATCRVLLCTHLAFNLSVPRSRRWLTILLIANLAAINAPRTMRLPPDTSTVNVDPARVQMPDTVLSGKGQGRGSELALCTSYSKRNLRATPDSFPWGNSVKCKVQNLTPFP